MKAIQRAERGEAPWIEERGERHGNNRKLEAEMKRRRRRIKRAQNKAEFNKELVNELNE